MGMFEGVCSNWAAGLYLIVKYDKSGLFLLLLFLKNVLTTNDDEG